MKVLGRKITLKLVGEWVLCVIITLAGGILALVVFDAVAGDIAQGIVSSKLSLYAN